MEMNSSHTHKASFWYLLGVLFKKILHRTSEITSPLFAAVQVIVMFSFDSQKVGHLILTSHVRQFSVQFTCLFIFYFFVGDVVT